MESYDYSQENEPSKDQIFFEEQKNNDQQQYTPNTDFEGPYKSTYPYVGQPSKNFEQTPNIDSLLQENNLVGSQMAGKIEIYVIDPVIKENLGKFVIYSIRGSDKDGAFFVTRRYSDFDKLRASLLQRWPGCYVPPLPPKQALGNLENDFIEERRKFLQNFCKKMTELPHLYYSEEFTIFLRNPNTEFEKCLAALPKQSYEDILQKYQVNFKMLSGKEINTELVLKITYFQNYLKKVKPMLENFKDMARNAAKAKKNYIDQLNTMSNYLLPDYEKHCLSEYLTAGEDRLIFANTGDQKLTSLTSLIKDTASDNCFVDLELLLKDEMREVSAFQDALNSKTHYENIKEKLILRQKEEKLELQKYLAGKTTFKSVLKSGSKEDRIKSAENEIAELGKELENVQFLCDIITVILGYVEIDRFKKEKIEIYYDVIKRLAFSELDYSKNMQEFWTHIVNNPNLVGFKLGAKK